MTNIFTSNGKYPGSKIALKDKYKRLYHFTSFDSFVKIWLSGKLLFGDIQKVNDLQEAKLPPITSRNLRHWAVMSKFRELRLKFKQISLCMDYDSYIMGCMSTQMWAYYADKSHGICIGLDFDKLKFPPTCLHGPVKYKKYTTHITLDPKLSTTKDIRRFIKRNKSTLFFTKQFTWKGENEYRIVSDSDSHIDISEAISCIYVTDIDSVNFELLVKLLDGKVPIRRLKFSNIQGVNIPKLSTDAISEKKTIDTLKSDGNQVSLHRQILEKIEECKNDENKSLLMP